MGGGASVLHDVRENERESQESGVLGIAANKRRMYHGYHLPNLLWELKVRPEHRLRSKTRLLDDSMNVQEKFRISAREVCKIAFGHCTQMSFHIIREVLIMMFL